MALFVGQTLDELLGFFVEIGITFEKIHQLTVPLGVSEDVGVITSKPEGDGPYVALCLFDRTNRIILKHLTTPKTLTLVTGFSWYTEDTRPGRSIRVSPRRPRGTPFHARYSKWPYCK